MEGLTLNFVSVSRYLGAYLGPQAELEACVKPQVEAWAEMGTEERAGGAGHLKAHPTAAVSAAAVGGPVTAGTVTNEEEIDISAGYLTTQTIRAALATLAGRTLRAGPTPA